MTSIPVAIDQVETSLAILAPPPVNDANPVELIPDEILDDAEREPILA